jgi:hypothetical protein
MQMVYLLKCLDHLSRDSLVAKSTIILIFSGSHCKYNSIRYHSIFVIKINLQ